jgi:outer membrane biosynthesis protein TonB
MAWWDSLKTLSSTPSLKSIRTSARPSGVILRGTHLAAYRPSGRFQSVSLVAHLVFILILIYTPAASRAREAAFDTVPADSEKIYYRLTVLDPAKKLPRIAPEGAGARPGKGDLVEKMPALGSTALQHNLTVVSRPLRPDNKRQTIFQPAVPPDLRITAELKLPNIVEAKPIAVPKPQMNFHPKDSKPVQPNKQNVTTTAPALTATNTTTPLTDLTDPTKAEPAMPVQPPSAPSPAPTQANAAPDASSPAGMETQGTQGSGLVVISTDPGLPSDMVALPTGNRFADFSISPAGGALGAPNGTSHGTSGVGTGGGAGGDISTGLGKGEAGGGGGKSGGSGSLSVSGSGGGGGAAMAGTLGPGVPLSMVYPVMTNLLPRKNSLVVSAGPIGGGGLGVYGALHCGKIYTVFLQMPGKAWTLQFCQSGAGGAKPPTQVNSAVVHMEQGISPPDADERFDFKRLPLPEDKIHKLIVLKGSLKEDGTIEGLQVHQGLLPMMDEAARLAFSKWKFRPATRGGKAIAVDILVGIPSDPPLAKTIN